MALNLSPLVSEALAKTDWRTRAHKLYHLRWFGLSRMRCLRCGRKFWVRQSAVVCCRRCAPDYGVKLETKMNCKHCYGRGYVGLFKDGTPQVCVCANAVLMLTPKE